MSRVKKKSPFYLTAEMAIRFSIIPVDVYLNGIKVNQCYRFKSGTDGFVECFHEPLQIHPVNDCFRTFIKRGTVTFKLPKK